MIDRPLNSEDIPGYMFDDFRTFIKDHDLTIDSIGEWDSYLYEDLAKEWLEEIIRSMNYYGEDFGQ